MNLLRRLADNTSPDSFASVLRRRRFRLFRKFISEANKKPLRVLDVGGTLNFWKGMDFLGQRNEIELTLLNLFKTESRCPRVTCVVGDARNMTEFHDRQFDVVFSNSVIEHVGDLADQKKMAQEIRRVGGGYFVQTPNLYFPVEPHFLFPFFQFFPVGLKAFLLRHFRVGWHGPYKTIEKARKVASSVRLLKKSELARLFPDGKIREERFLGLVKSFIVYRPHASATLTNPRPLTAPQSAAPAGGRKASQPLERSSTRLTNRDRRPGSCASP